jgi:hypothetical protein
MESLNEYLLAMRCGTQYSDRQSLMDVLYGCHPLYPPKVCSKRGQNKAAKLIFSPNMTILKSVLFLEFGWEPINDFLDKQSISYFSRLQNLPCTRRCKIIFDELKDSQSHPKWDYLNNVRRVFENAGLDHYLNSYVDMITFKKFFGEYVRSRETTNAKSKSSLPNYVHFPIMFGKQPYLSNVLEFQPTRLKLLARTNTLSINSVLHRRKLHTTSVCEMCSSGSDEDLFHFMLDCPEYTPIRNNYLNLITERFPGLAFLRVVALRQHAILIGDVSFSLDTNIGLFFDKIGKTMLQQYVFTQEVLFRKQDNITICDNSIPVSRF